MKKSLFYSAALAISLLSAAAFAEDYIITLKDHKFTPEQLEIPAGQKVKVIVKNQDPTPAEFESHDLKIEKIITGNGQAIVNVGPLKAGTYKFVDEFHEDVAKGAILVK